MSCFALPAIVFYNLAYNTCANTQRLQYLFCRRPLLRGNAHEHLGMCYARNRAGPGGVDVIEPIVAREMAGDDFGDSLVYYITLLKPCHKVLHIICARLEGRDAEVAAGKRTGKPPPTLHEIREIVGQ
jgi:hypothetical protein